MNALSRIVARALVALLILPTYVKGQVDYTWWNEVHQWDGHSPWTEYLTISPAYMGPNALPVPEVQNGKIRDEIELENSFDAYFGQGDQTEDWFLRLNVPVARGKVSLEGWVVPLEHFRMDSATRDERAARDFSGEGWAGGDIYLSTKVQLLRSRRFLPDAVFEMTFRTASGTHLRNARFTDGAGFYGAVAIGRTFSLKSNLIDSLRLYGMGGFYSWQIYTGSNRQNDAPLYGGGISIMVGKLDWCNELGGYSGYLNNGDRPLVYRTRLSLLLKKLLISFTYQKGLRDFPYSGIRMSFTYHLRTLK